MKEASDSKKGTTIYLTSNVNKALKEAAKKEDRSFTKQIERILKDWLMDKGYLEKGE